MPSSLPISTRVNNPDRPQYLYGGELPTLERVTAVRMWSSASTAPGANTDGMDSSGMGQNFFPGDFWVKRDTSTLYLCADNTQKAAVWRIAFSATGGKVIQEVDSPTVTLGSSAEYISVVHTATAPVTITLPLASTYWDADNSIGFEFVIADTGANAAANNITINTNPADTMVYDTTGVTCLVINTDGTVLRFIAINSTTWKVW